jgi:5-carboxymethyl-2-hydroxymuconate isomerase
MPQITLEYSSNIEQPVDDGALLGRVHELVSSVAGLPVGNCKSRVNVCDRFRVGTGGADKGFVHLEVRMLSGRPGKTKRELGEKILEFLYRYFTPAAGTLDLQITVEVQDIDRDFYFKRPSETLNPGDP